MSAESIATPRDEELVARSQARDPEAFRQLVDRHKDLVFAVALARTGDRGLAEDATQEAFVTAWRQLGGLREPERVGPWVAGIARNLAANAIRTRARQRRAIDPPLPPATPIDEVLEREDRELLARALGEIPAAHREALVLHYLDGQPVACIAEVLGVSEDLVKQRLSRGRRALRAGVAARVEQALVRARPGPGFSAAVIAATTAGASTLASAAGKGVTVMSIKKGAIAAAAIAALGVAGGAVYMSRADGERAPETTRRSAAESVPGATGQPGDGETRPRARRIDPATRPALVEAIRRARTAREGSRGRRTTAAEPPPSLPAAAEGDLDKEYIRDAVRELLPFVRECYEAGLENDPSLAGTITIKMTIEGEPEVGGVVGESSIDPEQTTLLDPSVLECVQETMYGLEIDPPTGGGVVQVTYPFAFSTTAE